MMKIGKAGIGVLARSVAVYVFGISAAFAAYPSGPITLIVPFGAGGITDLVARATAKVLSDQLKQPIIVDNRPGAGAISPQDDLNMPSQMATPSCSLRWALSPSIRISLLI